ncbi:hypothetical protein Tsubulata_019854 [Turnera subulata]|uniref:Protein kinase domain-containing protein n=1 Tax=Turnera subulata TaxID=218843 RepID=A0A9Q0JPT5_9ROSI|nr:hypothetical protein Tsubulata_019854 [Turnera subulata]
MAFTMVCRKWSLLLGLLVAFTSSFSLALTDLRDVTAINSLYVSLGFPALTRWVPFGGDPCGEEWQGISCVFSNVTAIKLNALNLGGMLNENLGNLESIIEIDLSDNHIGGSIPSLLPPTLRNLSLSRNQFTGTIPDTLSTLTQLEDLSFHNNLLTGEIPDAFQQLRSLVHLDLAGNNLTGQLPPSLGNLSSLDELHLQNNKLTGTLDVLQDLPLQYLNVEDNLFSGPIPEKLFSIPTFRKDGNPFNTTPILSPSPPPAIPPSSSTPPFAESPQKQANWPFSSNNSPPEKSSNFFTTRKVIGIAVLGAAIIVFLGICCICYKRRKSEEDVEADVAGAYKGHMVQPDNKSSIERSDQEQKVLRESTFKSSDRHGLDNGGLATRPNPRRDYEVDPKRMAAYSIPNPDRKNEMPGANVNSSLVQPPPPPSGKVLSKNQSAKCQSSCSTRVFTIATLQQHTNSFAEENFVGEGTLGSVYKAELPDGNLLAVKKLNSTASRQLSDEDFLQLVSTMSKIQHVNIVAVLGYCNERSQRLLIFEYFENGTLYDALHVDGEIHEKLSWNVRIRLALGSARALQHLHEVCQPPIMHMNFKSSNIMLDDKLGAHVSDCGLAPLRSSGPASEVSGRLLIAHGYAAPEFELGTYTCKSDVYSFGVVMLELLTGRKSYDRSRSRGEQSLVRWAIPQLHDIDSLSRMVDPSLNGAYPAKALSRFADIISRCVQASVLFFWLCYF